MNATIMFAMGEFAANTKSDLMSVTVSRVLQKLHNVDKPYEQMYSTLTPADQRIIAMFERHVPANSQLILQEVN